MTVLFTEADKLYANYVSVVNELSAKQAKEKRVHGVASLVRRCGKMANPSPYANSSPYRYANSNPQPGPHAQPEPHA